MIVGLLQAALRIRDLFIFTSQVFEETDYIIQVANEEESWLHISLTYSAMLHLPGGQADLD